MKLINTTEAVGHVLCHDLTQIIKDEFKGVRFKKGHVVTEEDVPVLVLARVQAVAERDAVKKTPLENHTTFPNPYNKAPLLCKGALLYGLLNVFIKRIEKLDRSIRKIRNILFAKDHVATGVNAIHIQNPRLRFFQRGNADATRHLHLIRGVKHTLRCHVNRHIFVIGKRTLQHRKIRACLFLHRQKHRFAVRNAVEIHNKLVFENRLVPRGKT